MNNNISSPSAVINEKNGGLGYSSLTGYSSHLSRPIQNAHKSSLECKKVPGILYAFSAVTLLYTQHSHLWNAYNATTPKHSTRFLFSILYLCPLSFTMSFILHQRGLLCCGGGREVVIDEVHVVLACSASHDTVGITQTRRSWWVEGSTGGAVNCTTAEDQALYFLCLWVGLEETIQSERIAT